MTGTAVAQDTVRIRGTIENEAGGVYFVRTRDNKLVMLKLAPNAGVAASIKSSLSDIQTGLYIGIAALPQADGSLRALEAHIFDETMRGTAEGHRAWDLLPKSTMTNAVVHEVIRAIDGHMVTLRYKDGEQQVVISVRDHRRDLSSRQQGRIKTRVCCLRTCCQQPARRHLASPARDGRSERSAASIATRFERDL